jgi:vesicle coat complex subunit
VRIVLLGVTVAIAVCASGCHDPQPTLSGGKPVSHWVEALRHPDAKVRKEAAFKLGNVGSSDPLVVPALIEALKDLDAGVRREAILALVKCESDNRNAESALQNLRDHDPDPEVRGYAAKALVKLHGGTSHDIPPQ